jgi:prepilin-type N-terminal cleavage/methylation domain-containing protein
MKTRPTQTGFTLIELLVVISIIAILAGISMPIYQTAVMTGRQAAASNAARQIGLGLRMYANDYDSYPTKKNLYGEDIKTSNDVFRCLIPTYIDNEKVFAVPNSKAGPTNDNDTSSPSMILAAHENHWAYVDGLSTTSNSSWPLIVDCTDGSGYYNDQQNKLGGLWKGTKTVTVFADGSSRVVPLLGPAAKRYLPRSDDRSKNALTVSDYMGEEAKVLEPQI